jgi:hypothetical protein
MRVHTVKSTGLHVPPAPIKGTKGPVLPGGLPPTMKSSSRVFFMAPAKGSRNRLAGFYDPRRVGPPGPHDFDTWVSRKIDAMIRRKNTTR